MIIRVPHILLIDDDKHTNLLHELTITQSIDNAFIKSFNYAEEALGYLKNNLIHIDIICSDLRMPRMNGKEFLAQYQSIYDRHNSAPKVLMLSDSISLQDLQIIKSYDCVLDVQNKPLRMEYIEEYLVVRHQSN